MSTTRATGKLSATSKQKKINAALASNQVAILKRLDILEAMFHSLKKHFEDRVSALERKNERDCDYDLEQSEK